MKIDRLIGILSILLQTDLVTAPELAEKFEVSRRTINRDIEALGKAGIPIQTIQGTGGGIRIMDGFRMDRTLLTSRDMQGIMAGLRSLDSVSGSHYYSRLMEKIKPGASSFITGRDSILIDLSSWYKDSITPKVTTIQDAIEERRILAFRYYAPKSISDREVEPYYLIFKWSSWYLWGYCLKKEDFRLFKLNRMDFLVIGKQEFKGREVPMPDLSIASLFPPDIEVQAIFDAEMKWKLVEEFGPHCFRELSDGRLYFREKYSDEESLIVWLLTFGDKVEILEPASVRKELLKIANGMKSLYEDNRRETAPESMESREPECRTEGSADTNLLCEKTCAEMRRKDEKMV